MSLPLFGLGALMSLDVVQNIPLHHLYMRHLSIATRRLEKNLRSALARRFQYLSMHFYQGRDSGLLQTKVIRDVEMVQMAPMHACTWFQARYEIAAPFVFP